MSYCDTPTIMQQDLERDRRVKSDHDRDIRKAVLEERNRIVEIIKGIIQTQEAASITPVLEALINRIYGF